MGIDNKGMLLSQVVTGQTSDPSHYSRGSFDQDVPHATFGSCKQRPSETQRLFNLQAGKQAVWFRPQPTGWVQLCCSGSRCGIPRHGTVSNGTEPLLNQPAFPPCSEPFKLICTCWKRCFQHYLGTMLWVKYTHCGLLSYTPKTRKEEPCRAAQSLHAKAVDTDRIQFLRSEVLFCEKCKKSWFHKSCFFSHFPARNEKENSTHWRRSSLSEAKQCCAGLSYCCPLSQLYVFNRLWNFVSKERFCIAWMISCNGFRM